MVDLLQEAGNVLSAPRRGLWHLLGAPFGLSMEDTESGASLLGAMGMDQSDPWTSVLGLGAEILGDPLTWGGGAILGSLGKASKLGVADDAARALSSRNVAQNALVRQAASNPGEAAQIARFRGMGDIIDPEALALGAEKSIANPNPQLAAWLERSNLATRDPSGSLRMQGGFHLPEGRTGAMGNRGGIAGQASAKGPVADFMKTRPSRGENLVPNVYGPGHGGMPTDFPSQVELDLIRQAARQQGVAGSSRGANARLAMNPEDVFDTAARASLPARPIPDPMVRMGAQNLPAGQAFDESQQLLELTQTKQRGMALLEALGRAGLIGGGGGLGVGAGMYLGGQP